MQPGQLIVPHDDQKPADSANAQNVVAPQQPAAAQAPAPAPTPPAPAAPQPSDPTPAPMPQQPAASVPPEEPAPSLYKPAPDPSDATHHASTQTQDEDVMWTATEFVDNHKGTNWYLSLLGVGVLAAAGAYFLLKDLFSAIVIVLAIVAFAVYASRKPRQQQYHLNTFGVQVGNKVYEFHDFKAFSVTHDADVVSVALRPLKRFMPTPTLYVIPEVEDRVIELLSMVMPSEQHRPDAIDSLMRKIRF